MDRELHVNLIASRNLEVQLRALVADVRMANQERTRRIGALVASASSTRVPLADAWEAAGRPEPLGYRYSNRADKSEWFDGWREVEYLVLELLEEHGLTRETIEARILNGEAPFDDVLECEELGSIYRSNEEPPEE
jgi:hypothetical protein